jgi:hypothetical protein
MYGWSKTMFQILYKIWSIKFTDQKIGLKMFFAILHCKLFGHVTNPPLIEAWENHLGGPRSYYLCRRCFLSIGEKPYV